MTKKRKVKEPDWSKAQYEEWESGNERDMVREFTLYFTRKGKIAKVQRPSWVVRLRGKSQENSAPFFTVVKRQYKSKKKGSRWGRKYGDLYYIAHPPEDLDGTPFHSTFNSWKEVVDYMEEWGKLAYISKRKGQEPRWCLRGYSGWC